MIKTRIRCAPVVHDVVATSPCRHGQHNAHGYNCRSKTVRRQFRTEMLRGSNCDVSGRAFNRKGTLQTLQFSRVKHRVYEAAVKVSPYRSVVHVQSGVADGCRLSTSISSLSNATDDELKQNTSPPSTMCRGSASAPDFDLDLAEAVAVLSTAEHSFFYDIGSVATVADEDAGGVADNVGGPGHPVASAAATKASDARFNASSHWPSTTAAVAASALSPTADGRSEANWRGGPSAPPAQATDLCLCCGDKASGFHYNAYTCEGCKGFFRRSILKQATYSCKYGGQCEMDTWMRRKCPACRLRRCFEIGMRPECLSLTERRKPSADQGPKSIAAKQRAASKAAKAEQEEEDGGNVLDMLTEAHRDLVENVVTYQEIFELPSESDILAIQDVKFSEELMPADMPSAIFQHMTRMTMLTTHLVIEFAKRLVGFSELRREDQIVLLKGSASEVMVLRTSRRYNPEVDEVIFGDGTPVTRDSLCIAGLTRSYVNDMFQFSQKMSLLAVDNAEYSLLTAICIFSDRPGVTDTRTIDDCRDRYVGALVEYNHHRRSGDRKHIARLLLMLVELRTLSHSHAQALHKLRIDRGQLPPLLSEYFDLFE